MRAMMSAAVLALVAGSAAAQDGLVVGFDDTASGGPTVAWIYDEGQWSPLFAYGAPNNADVWAAAVDPATCTLYIGSGLQLFSLQPGGTLTLLGTVTIDGVSMTFTGLAWHGGRLIAYRSVTDEGMYSIDVQTLEATRIWTQTVGAFSTGWDFGGLDSDGTTLYGLTDTVPTGQTRGLYTIDLAAQSATLVVASSAYPGNPGGGSTDIDGLAIGGGKAYFVVDQPGDIAVYNLTSNAFETGFPNPFPTSEIFSAGAWAPCFLGPPPCPADFNGDGFLDFFDFDDFVSCFEGIACPPGKDADFNDDGFTDFFDFDDFTAAFEAGCPG